MTDSIRCRRCNEEKPPLPRAPLPGRAGQQVLAGTCQDCWGEWQQAEVMVINELRLNFVDPEAGRILERHMSDFLFLDDTPPPD